MAANSQLDLLLVRAGRTSWEDAGRIVGAADLPVSPTGLDRVRAAVEEVRPIDIHLVLHAPDEASTTTASVLSAALDGRIRPVPDLREMSLGLWEGMAESDLRDKLPRCYRAWRTDPECVCPPEGEAVGEVQERLLAGLHRGLSRVKDGVCAVVLRPIAFAIVAEVLAPEVAPGGSENPRRDWIRVRFPRNLLRPRGMASSRRSA